MLQRKQEQQRARARLVAIAVALSVVAGATDVLSFLRLGQVFTSVMTGNLVLLGVGAGSGALDQVTNTGVAIGGYLLGTAAGARIAVARDDDPDVVWPRRVTVALGVELVVFVGLLAGWEMVEPRPAGVARLLLLVGGAAAMGIQSAATRQVRLKGLSTTYFTSTLTSVVEEIVLPGRRVGVRSVLQLVALAAGACAGALLIAHAARFVLVLQCVLLALVIATVTLAGSGLSSRRSGR